MPHLIFGVTDRQKALCSTGFSARWSKSNVEACIFANILHGSLGSLIIYLCCNVSKTLVHVFRPPVGLPRFAVELSGLYARATPNPKNPAGSRE